jgi:hypothetical protein
MKKSRIVAHPVAVESPRHLPLVDLLVDARTELFELAVRSGLKVLETMLEEDRTALCGPRYAHMVERGASRAGTVSSEVVLGGRKVAVRRPRVRAGGQEVTLPTFQAMAAVDPLNRRVVEQMLVGVATRRYARSLEPVPTTMRSRGTSKSAVSRRFVTKTAAQLAAWQTASLESLDLVGLLIDGVHIGEHCLIVALGIAADGQKHALGLWDGSTENARVCQDLLANLQSRGLRTDRSLLGHPRRLEGAAEGGARDLRRRGPGAALSRPLCRPPDYADPVDGRASGGGARVSDVGIITAPRERRGVHRTAGSARGWYAPGSSSRGRAL